MLIRKRHPVHRSSRRSSLAILARCAIRPRPVAQLGKQFSSGAFTARIGSLGACAFAEYPSAAAAATETAAGGVANVTRRGSTRAAVDTRIAGSGDTAAFRVVVHLALVVFVVNHGQAHGFEEHELQCQYRSARMKAMQRNMSRVYRFLAESTSYFARHQHTISGAADSAPRFQTLSLMGKTHLFQVTLPICPRPPPPTPFFPTRRHAKVGRRWRARRCVPNRYQLVPDLTHDDTPCGSAGCCCFDRVELDFPVWSDFIYMVSLAPFPARSIILDVIVTLQSES